MQQHLLCLNKAVYMSSTTYLAGFTAEQLQLYLSNMNLTWMLQQNECYWDIY